MEAVRTDTVERAFSGGTSLVGKRIISIARMPVDFDGAKIIFQLFRINSSDPVSGVYRHVLSGSLWSLESAGLWEDQSRMLPLKKTALLPTSLTTGPERLFPAAWVLLEYRWARPNNSRSLSLI